jgi:hypothetical protein
MQNTQPTNRPRWPFMRGLERLKTHEQMRYFLFASLAWVAVLACRSESSARAKTREPTIQGWEDIQIGKPPPADAKQFCVQGALDAEIGPQTIRCEGCRSAALPLPCVKLLIQGGTVSFVAAVLPDGNDDHQSLVQAYLKTLGAPNEKTSNDMFDVVRWNGERTTAELTTNYYDFDLKQKVRRLSPRVVLIITEKIELPAARRTDEKKVDGKSSAVSNESAPPAKQNTPAPTSAD